MTSRSPFEAHLERKGGTNPPSIRWQRIVISLYYIRKLERVDGIEPTTNSLEDCDSTTELHPQLEDPGRFELPTLGLKVPCTTYCATDPL